MEQLDEKSQEMFENLGNPDVIDRFIGRKRGKIPQDDEFKAKYEALVERIKALRGFFATEAHKNREKMKIYTQEEEYFKANEAKAGAKYADTIVVNLTDILKFKRQTIIILDDTGEKW